MPNEHLVCVRLTGGTMQALVREGARQSIEAGRSVSLASVVRKAIIAYLPPTDSVSCHHHHSTGANPSVSKRS